MTTPKYELPYMTRKSMLGHKLFYHCFTLFFLTTVKKTLGILVCMLFSFDFFDKKQLLLTAMLTR
jgi:hypothetical protein